MNQEPLYCIYSTMYCTEERCPRYIKEMNYCKQYLAADIIIEGSQPTEKAEPIPLTRGMPPPRLDPFPELKPRTYLPTITGRVMDEPVMREVNTRQGPTEITNFKITDGKVEARVGLWGELGNVAKNFRVNDIITLTGMSVKEPYQGVNQISSTKNTEIE